MSKTAAQQWVEQNKDTKAHQHAADAGEKPVSGMHFELLRLDVEEIKTHLKRKPMRVRVPSLELLAIIALVAFLRAVWIWLNIDGFVISFSPAYGARP